MPPRVGDETRPGFGDGNSFGFKNKWGCGGDQPPKEKGPGVGQGRSVGKSPRLQAGAAPQGLVRKGDDKHPLVELLLGYPVEVF